MRTKRFAAIGAIALVTLVLVAGVLWWRLDDDRPVPLLVWAVIKGLLWSKTAAKIAIATVLGGAVLWRALATRARNRRTPQPSVDEAP
jgi:hypothetical protein